VDTILEMAEHRNRPRSKCVAGCLVERYRDRSSQEFPKWTSNRHGEVNILNASNEIRPLRRAGLLSLTSHPACFPRGHAATSRSRRLDHPAVLHHPQLRGDFAARLIGSRGGEPRGSRAREITLIGKHHSYGDDLGLRDGSPNTRAPCANRRDWPGSLLYAYPNRVTQRLLDTLPTPRL